MHGCCETTYHWHVQKHLETYFVTEFAGGSAPPMLTIPFLTLLRTCSRFSNCSFLLWCWGWDVSVPDAMPDPPTIDLRLLFISSRTSELNFRVWKEKCTQKSSNLVFINQWNESQKVKSISPCPLVINQWVSIASEIFRVFTLSSIKNVE